MFVIAEPCIDEKDASCVDACPVDCIYEGERQFYIHPDECIDCNACVPVCPVDAIYPLSDLPARWASYEQVAIAWFAAHPEAEGGGIDWAS